MNKHLLETAEGRARLAKIRSFANKWLRAVGAELQTYAENGDIPGYKMREVTRYVAKDNGDLLNYLKTQDIDISGVNKGISINPTALCNDRPDINMEDLISKGLIIEKTTKQIVKA